MWIWFVCVVCIPVSEERFLTPWLAYKRACSMIVNDIPTQKVIVSELSPLLN